MIDSEIKETKKRKKSEPNTTPFTNPTGQMEAFNHSNQGFPPGAPYVWELLQIPDIAEFFIRQGVLNPELAPNIDARVLNLTPT
ncbi:hypothetical protein FRX31_025760 [Thalictrum thalictroides]|uniref:Uncharacterized protein n=1 Tax=Thalictrum thalictroides TaxID=46969 RepID=A0A7J6VK08_THATH|nr:hypothetical protein FRX31_025760 [Thalictrum thalictroides]